MDFSLITNFAHAHIEFVCRIDKRLLFIIVHGKSIIALK